jgi:hypothetical protein
MNWSDMQFRPPAPSGSRNLLAPSSAPSLPGLVSCRIRSWGHPPELSSSRAAVRCFQRRSPLDVRNAFRVLLHAGVRHPVQLFKLKTERVALLGLFPSRVLSLPTLARPSSDLPSCGCRLRRKRLNQLHYRVSHVESTAGLSRDCRPSWGLWPSGRHTRSSHALILESPPKAPGVRHRPLNSPSLNLCFTSGLRHLHRQIRRSI